MAALTFCVNLYLIFYLPGRAGGIVRSNTLFVVTIFPSEVFLATATATATATDHRSQITDHRSQATATAT